MGKALVVMPPVQPVCCTRRLAIREEEPAHPVAKIRRRNPKRKSSPGNGITLPSFILGIATILVSGVARLKCLFSVRPHDVFHNPKTRDRQKGRQEGCRAVNGEPYPTVANPA